MPFFLLDRSLFSCFHLFHSSHTYWQILLWFNQKHLKSYPKEAVLSCFDFTLSQDNHNWDQMFLHLGICNLKKVMMQPEYPYFLHKEILVPIIIDIRNGKTSVFLFFFPFLMTMILSRSCYQVFHLTSFQLHQKSLMLFFSKNTFYFNPVKYSQSQTARKQAWASSCYALSLKIWVSGVLNLL